MSGTLLSPLPQRGLAAVGKRGVVREQPLDAFATLPPGLPHQTGQCHIAGPTRSAPGSLTRKRLLGQQPTHSGMVFSQREPPRRLGPASQPGLFSAKPLATSRTARSAHFSLHRQEMGPSRFPGPPAGQTLIRGIGSKHQLGWKYFLAEAHCISLNDHV